MGRFVGLDLFSNKEWSCHADELFLMWKPSFIPFDTVYTGRDSCQAKEASHADYKNLGTTTIVLSNLCYMYCTG